MPTGQTTPNSSEGAAPATPQKDSTQSLDALGDGGTALDALHEQTIKSKAPPEEPAPPEELASPQPEAKPVDNGGEGTAGSPDDGKQGGTPEAGAKGSEVGGDVKPAIPPSEKPSESAETKDDLEDIRPPEGTSPKTAEAWEAFKGKARESIKAAEERAKSLAEEKIRIETELKELQEKAKDVLSEEQKKEIEELRKWHAASEIESAPELTSFDSKIAANTDTLLTKLKEAGMVEAQVAEIRKIGIDRVNWEDIKPHLSSTLRTLVDAKVLQHVSLSDERDSKFSELKKDGDAYMAQKRQEREQAEAQARQQFEATVTGYARDKTFDFLKVKDIPRDVSPEEVEALKADNSFAEDMQKSIENWKQHLDDPRMQAELLFGSVMAYKFQRDFNAATKRAKTLEAELNAEREKFAQVQRASGAGRRTGNAPAPPVPAGSQISNEKGEIKKADAALDELAARYLNR